MSLPISGFTAVPNPMMLSFLATQGFAIMYYGGAGWQFGKRKVSGMSNEEVNKMSPNEFLMRLHSETRTMVPTMAQGMKDMTPLVKTTLVLFGAYIREAIKAFPEVVQNILGSTDSGEFSNIPTTTPQSGNLPPQMASFLHYFATLSKATQSKIVEQAESPFDNQITAQVGNPVTGNEKPTNLIPYKGKWASLQMLQNLVKAKGKSLEKQEIKQISTAQFLSPAEKAGQLLHGKKKAGQSQILEKAKLIAGIKKRKAQSLSSSGNDKLLALKSLKTLQQLLANLLARYYF